MEKNFTKGEWTTEDETFNNGDGSKTGTINIRVDEIWIADCKPYFSKDYQNFPDYKEAVANANLIAASPAMLEALEQCVRTFETNRTGGCNGEGVKPEDGSPYVLAKEAITKALTGE